MHEPTGFSGVHTVPKIRHSCGRLLPRRMAPHSQCLVVGHRTIGQRKALFGVEIGERAANAHGRIGQHAEAAPLERFAQFEYLGHQLLRLAVAVTVDGARKLVFHLGAPVVDLAYQHQDRLHDVERLETGDHHRLLVLRNGS